MSVERFICAGPQRTGSTWLFNAMRLIASPCLAVPITRYIGLSSAERHVIKTHGYIPGLEGVVFMTMRDEQEQIQSAIRMGFIVNDPASIDPWIAEMRGHQSQWECRAKLIIAYEDIVDRPAAAIARISEAMKMPADTETLAVRLAALPGEITKEGWDEVTLLHKGHCTRPRLSP